MNSATRQFIRSTLNLTSPTYYPSITQSNIEKSLTNTAFLNNWINLPFNYTCTKRKFLF